MKTHLPIIITGLFASIFGFMSFPLKAQPTIDDYQRADSTRNYPGFVFYSAQNITWVDSTRMCWYRINTPTGYEYWLLDTERLKKKPLFDTKIFCAQLAEDFTIKCNPKKLSLQNLTVSKDLCHCEFEIDKISYRYDLKKNQFEKLKESKEKKEEYWGNSFDETKNKPVVSPDSSQLAFIKNYNVYVSDKIDKKEIQLSFDGSEGEFYSSYLHWSPDSKKLACFKVRPQTKKYMHFVEASPEDQFLPYLHQREYLRPGDAMPLKTPCIFNVGERQSAEVRDPGYPDQYSLENIQWSEDSEGIFFEYNQRGHHKYQVIRLDATTGEKQIIIDEYSPTFIDYSSKRYRYDLKKEHQIIWASERDGWNHLYRFDAKSGEMVNQITRGQWVVRQVLHIDEINKTILFAGSGMNPEEDPYYMHYYRINFNGGGLIDLTPEKMNHQAIFAPQFDQSRFLDTYSTVRESPVTVIRDAASGDILMRVEEADITQLLKAGYILPEPIVTKGRDGQTDIWGNLYRPSTFDSTQLYPVIEYIYAGPQGSFVQKSFNPYHYAITGLAELGFIIVQIDGMGTSNRSKAFHDVCYKNLKDAGFEDRIIWIKKAAENYPYIDTSRVGIFGGSAGGQNSTAALLFHPEFYKAGVSSCGCYDNRLDKMWWNEQWMGYPVGPHYAACSTIENAGNLEGNLMLILGEIDDNVDPASTYRLAKALIKQNKDFELVVLPGTNHTLGGEYGERKRRDFFVRHLLMAEPPEWNRQKNHTDN